MDYNNTIKQNLKSCKYILFESTGAQFRLSIDTMFSKTSMSTNRPGEKKDIDLLYRGNTGYATFNPNTFLVFTYLTKDYNTTKSFYTSYPHLSYLKEMFSRMISIISNNKNELLVKDPDGKIIANPSLTTDENRPVLDGVGKNNEWMRFGLTALSNSYDEGTIVPGVSIEISKAEGYASVLTLTEFYTLADEIEHLDLATIGAVLSTMACNERNTNELLYKISSLERKLDELTHSHIGGYGVNGVTAVPTYRHTGRSDGYQANTFSRRQSTSYSSTPTTPIRTTPSWGTSQNTSGIDSHKTVHADTTPTTSPSAENERFKIDEVKDSDILQNIFDTSDTDE